MYNAPGSEVPVRKDAPADEVEVEVVEDAPASTKGGPPPATAVEEEAVAVAEEAVAEAEAAAAAEEEATEATEAAARMEATEAAAARAAMAAAGQAAAQAGGWPLPYLSTRSCSMLATWRGPVEARTSRRR